MSGHRFAWWKILLALLIVVVLVVGGYFAYVFLTYKRIEDNVDLTVEGNVQEPAQTGKEYTAVSYNIGFGAYTADFTFFMDGGKESRARSKESVLECVNGSAQNALSFEPDIVLFQEVDTDSTRSWHVDQKEIIQSAFGEKGNWDSVFASNYHSAYLMYPLTKPHGKSNSGILTLSKMDITSSLRRSLPIATSFKKILDLDRCYNYSCLPMEQMLPREIPSCRCCSRTCRGNMKPATMSCVLVISIMTSPGIPLNISTRAQGRVLAGARPSPMRSCRMAS